MKQQAYALLAVLVLLATPAFGQGWNVDRISQSYQSWSEVMEIAKQGNYVYLGLQYGGLAVVDVSNLTDPIAVANLLREDDIYDVEVSGNFLYVATSRGIIILNISNPANPVEVAQILPPLSGAYFCLSGNLAFVITGTGPSTHGLNVLDISNPLNPRLIGTYPFPGQVSDPTASGNYLYIPMWSGGLWILDVSDPAQPTLAGSISGLWGNTWEMAVSGTVAYLPLTYTGLLTIDVSDPTHPTILGRGDFDQIDAIEVSGNLAYLGTIGDGLFIVDVSQPSHPVLLGNYAGPGPNSPLREMVVEEPYVYGAWDEYHFRITDVSNPQNPTNFSSYYANWDVSDVAYRDNYVYLAAGNEGLLINDVSDPTHPWQVSYLDDIGNIYEVLLLGNYAYMQTYNTGTKIVDISDPAHPVLAATYPLQGRIQKIVGELAYAEATSDVQILEVSSPLNPTQVGSYHLQNGAIVQLDTDGRFLYAIAWSESDMSSIDSLLVLDVNDPTHPQFMGLYPLGEPNSTHVLVQGDGYLYVSGTDFGLRVYDIQDPTQLTQVGQLTIPLDPGDMAVDGDFVYIACEGWNVSGPRIIDVSDPTRPFQTGYYMAPAAFTQRLALHDDYAYFTEEGLLVVYDCSDATHNDVNVTITPVSPPIQIPASGGNFDFFVFADNGGPGTLAVDLWTKAILPNGSVVEPLLGPASTQLDSGVTTWIRHQSVPANAPAGNYSYVLLAGEYPNAVWGSDTLLFEKLNTGDGPLVGDWGAWGEGLSSEAKSQAPASFGVIGAFPNPFNPSTAISYELRAANFVSLKVYDTAGRLVATLVDGWREAGEQEVVFDGSGMPSGVYLYRVTAGTWTETGKMILLK